MNTQAYACFYYGFESFSSPLPGGAFWLKGLADFKRPFYEGKINLVLKAAFNIRLAGGIDLEEFEKTTGFDLLLLASREIKELRRQKLVSLAKRRLRLTAQGFLFADYVSRKFV